MELNACAHQPRINEARPIALIHIGETQRQAEVLKLKARELVSVGSGVASVRIEVPPGEWLIWSDGPWALWVGDHADSLPGVVRDQLMHGEPSALVETIDRLAAVGVWCREAALLIRGEWTKTRRAGLVLADLPPSGASRLSGVFVDVEGASARLEVSAAGVCWTDRPSVTIEWLLSAVTLPAPT
jgi:hypothetical protein